MGVAPLEGDFVIIFHRSSMNSVVRNGMLYYVKRNCRKIHSGPKMQETPQRSEGEGEEGKKEVNLTEALKNAVAIDASNREPIRRVDLDPGRRCSKNNGIFN